MAAIEISGSTPAIDLSQVPTELLEQELNKRRKEAKELREELAYKKACCKNCAYRIYGKTSFDSAFYSDTWVCKKRPKKVPRRNFFGQVPKYCQAYYACDRKYDGCKMFLHKDSQKGKAIIEKNKGMYLRVTE